LKYRILSVVLSLLLLVQSQIIFAQDGSGGMSQGVIWLFVIFSLIIIALLLANIITKVYPQTAVERQDTTFFPGMDALMGKKKPSHIAEGSYTKLSKGFDIKLEGVAEELVSDIEVNTFAVQPPDFRGIAPIPKMMVEVGQEVKAGDALFYDKASPEIIYASPVSGELVEIRRGAKRAITEVIILADKNQTYRTLPSIDRHQTSREEIVQYLKSSGFWPLITQRPYDIVADPTITPRDIFISTFDTAPLAPNMDFIVNGKETEFQVGLDLLVRLTDGHVHLGLNARPKSIHSAYANAKGVEKHWFDGKHPAGNVGIQIHHVAPIRPMDTVWTLQVEDVILLGDMITANRYRPERIVAIAGNGAKNHHYVRTMIGANLNDLLKDQQIDDAEMRIIEGNVLSGKQSSLSGFLGSRVSQITIIPEGRNYDMFGWLLPAIDRPTISKTYPNFLFPSLSYEVDTNTHGEPRAFVQTGQYEAMLPANIYPQHLMKAIMIQDFEKMEGLGIHELSEEDVALCEFACTSKMPLQRILREGLDLMREQG
jgi:Na+-transporting NADH:ubiquinone oxidoreductase subunit A